MSEINAQDQLNTKGELRLLLERLDRAAMNLDGLAARRDPSRDEAHRLRGKAEGVRLAISYVEEALRVG